MGVRFMRIGIIGAMKIEVEQLKTLMKDVVIECFSGIEFYIGQLCGKEVIVAVSGVGKVNAAVCTQTMIMKYSPSMIINTGVAGGIGSGIEICDIVVATSVVQHDMDTTPVGDPLGFISGIDIVEIPCSELISEKLVQAANKLDKVKVYSGIIATGDKFINKTEDIRFIGDNFNAIASEMEGASIGQVCYINGVDFGVVRTISDGGDEASHLDFPKFLQIAVKGSIELMINFLNSI
jgi:adenosylhomocysteine nucleosidase